MRISDWSSDVCSSDLEDAEHDDHQETGQPAQYGADRRGDAADGAGDIVGDRLGIELETAHAMIARPFGDALDLRPHDRLQGRGLIGDMREIGSAMCRARVCNYV